jgi:hypothetical protein
MQNPTRALTSVALALVLLPACAGGMAPPSAESAATPPPPPPPAEPAPGAREESAGSGVSENFEVAQPSPAVAGNLAAFPQPAPRGGTPPAPPAPPPPPPGTKAPAVAESAAAAAVRAPMLIYTAQITMAVFEVNVSLAHVETIGRELGGFLAKRDDHSITIRVPSDRFDEAVRRVEGVGDMLHRNVAAEDVTEEFRDLQVRLRSAHAVQQRLTELLAKAVKVEESIAIERELDRVSGEIEHIEGRIKFLRDRAAFSTITVSFEPKAQEQVGNKEVHLPVHWLYDLGLRRLLSL